jgi:crotonobetainyl-CoA:carnitine CoA-transferase CaiB-like acyl-CoA transferase
MSVPTGARPLAGIRVIDLSRIYAGPYATFMLAAAGADVIKVEPRDGDSLRRRPARGNVPLPFVMINAGKRMVTLDLKTPAGRDLLERLLATADVLVENFRPGVMDRLGFGRRALAEKFPRLIYASASGYGTEGPYRDHPAMDLTVQAFSGVMDATGYPDGPPIKAGPAIVDYITGAHLYGGIVTALLHRERHGETTPVEVAMIDAIYPSLASNLGSAFAGAEGYIHRTGTRHGGLMVCPYNVYPAADGYVAIICNDNAHWRALTKVLARDDLAADERFASMAGRVKHMDFIDAEVAKETVKYVRDDLFERVNKSGGLCGAVRTLPEVLNDPKLRESGMLLDVEHPEFGRVTVPQSAIRFPDLPPHAYAPSRPLGADNAAIFCDELGLNAAELAALREKGAV